MTERRDPGTSTQAAGTRSRTAACISVIIPMRDAQATIGTQLEALAAQHYERPWEVIVADNGSSDAGRGIVHSFDTRLNLKVVDAADCPGVGAVRNRGANSAHGDLLVFIDADDAVSSNWLAAMARAATTGDLVGGRLDPAVLSPPHTLAWRDPPQPQHDLATALGFLPYATGACLGIWRDTFDQLDGFDESLRFAGDDVELCWRAQLRGYQLVRTDDALVGYRYRTSLQGSLTQAYRYGRGDIELYARFRGHIGRPRPKHLLLAYLRLLSGITALVRGADERGAWLWKVSNRFGRLAGSWHARVFYP